MTDKRGEQLQKRVEFTAKDDAQQIATGIVMVPDKVDLQGDYVREDLIRTFAEQFADFEEVGQADGGVMHAVWPSEHINLESNEVLDEKSAVGGQDVPQGSWVQSWKFEDPELWGLVSDGTLSGYSIGAVDVEWSNPIPQSELPDDVAVAEDYPEDEPVFELRSGIIREVSAVDIPAVPDALILETKAEKQEAMKRLADHLGNRDGFIQEAQERGHDEDAAQRLWDYLNRAVDIEGASEPGKESIFTRVGKAALSVLSGDDPDTDIDIAEFGKSADSDPELDPDGGGKNTADDMSENENDPLADAPEWARSLHDTVEQNSKQIEAVVEADAETPEGDADGEKDAFDEAPEWAKSLKEEIEQNSQRITDVATASGASQQLDGSETEAFGKYDSNWAKTLGLPTANGGAD